MRTSHPHALSLLPLLLCLGCEQEVVVLPSPFLPGHQVRVTQAAGIGTHSGKGRWAIDVVAAEGTALVAVASGHIVGVKQDSRRGGCDRSFAQDGNHVILRPDAGSHDVLYLHLAAHSTVVKEGDRVVAGQVIAKVGRSGWVCHGTHLHLQVQERCEGWWCASGPFRVDVKKIPTSHVVF